MPRALGPIDGSRLPTDCGTASGASARRRMVGVFIAATSTIGLRFGVLPRWLGRLGLILGVILGLTGAFAGPLDFLRGMVRAGQSHAARRSADAPADQEPDLAAVALDLVEAGVADPEVVTS